ncbi:MAG: YqgE/AlgH family protein [Saprospiraceae bacterium]|nr:YqgE/AlgH family protein [Saprospiraceae bacterium]
MNLRDISKGTLLLAEPFMIDPHFKRAVVLLCEHASEEGSIGFILNKPLHMQINELVADFPEIASEVYFGGPVATETVHFIHNVGELLEDSVEVKRGVFWGGDFEKLKFLIQSKLVLPGNVRFFVGYSGWSSGQLVEELGYKSWVTTEMHANYLFKSKPKHLWQQIMYNLGDRYSVIAQIPEQPCLN